MHVKCNRTETKSITRSPHMLTPYDCLKSTSWRSKFLSEKKIKGLFLENLKSTPQPWGTKLITWYICIITTGN